MRIPLLLPLVLIATLACASPPAAAEETYRVRKLQAFELARDTTPEATAALRELLREKPDDAEVLLRLATNLSRLGQKLDPGDDRKALLREARETFQRAAAAGSTDPLIATTLAATNADGSENTAVLAANKEVDRFLQLAEEAFGRQRFDVAVENFRAALAIEPTNYLALLHLGDTYFAGRNYGEAVNWFQKTMAVAPNAETPYRYCADALMHLGRKDEALDNYLSAIIAEPYNGYPWRALHEGCKALLLKPWMAAGHAPTAQISDSPDKPEIHLARDFTVFDWSYALARQQWIQDNRARRFPPGVAYRQTLEEETFALGTVLRVHAEAAGAKAPPDADAERYAKSSAALNELADINTAGLLEAHILFFRANADIAQDYAEFREQHRDKLRTYLWKYYLHLP